MHKNESGFTLIESLLVLVIIGFLFVFLIDALDLAGLQAKAQNASGQSAMTKVVLSVDSFVTAYSRVPNETEFLDALSSGSIEHEDSCTVFGVPNYECLFKLSSRELPSNCDLSNWRADKLGTYPCFIRYYSGNALSSNFDNKQNYRLYAKVFGRDNAFYVFDSLKSGVLFKCPSSTNDFDKLEDCHEL